MLFAIGEMMVIDRTPGIIAFVALEIVGYVALCAFRSGRRGSNMPAGV